MAQIKNTQGRCMQRPCINPRLPPIHNPSFIIKSKLFLGLKYFIYTFAAVLAFYVSFDGFFLI
jgi:hypothetical protein